MGKFILYFQEFSLQSPFLLFRSFLEKARSCLIHSLKNESEHYHSLFVFFFCLGIVLFLRSHVSAWFCIFIALLLIVHTFFAYRRATAIKISAGETISFHIVFFFFAFTLGMGMSALHLLLSPVQPIQTRSILSHPISGTVEQVVSQTPQKTKFLLRDHQTKTILVTSLKGNIHIKAQDTIVVTQGTLSPFVFLPRIAILRNQSGYLKAKCYTVTAHQTKNISLQTQILEKIKKIFPEQEGGLISVFVTGTKDNLAPHIQDDFRKTGLSHILSISGLHIMLIFGVFFQFFLFLLRRFQRITNAFNIEIFISILSLIFVFAYLAFIGFLVPATRAFLMLFLSILAASLSGTLLSRKTLATAFIILVSYKPFLIFDIGFQLSFAATAALIHCIKLSKEEKSSGNILIKIFNVIKQHIKNITKTTFFASLLTVPYIHYYFSSVATFGILANIPVLILLSFFFVPLLLFYFPLILLFPSIPSEPITIVASLILQCAHFFSEISHTLILIPYKPQIFATIIVFQGLFYSFYDPLFKRISFILFLLFTFVPLISIKDYPDVITFSHPNNIFFRSEDGLQVLYTHRTKQEINYWKKTVAGHKVIPCQSYCRLKKHEKIWVGLGSKKNLKKACQEADIIFVPPHMNIQKQNQACMLKIIVAEDMFYFFTPQGIKKEKISKKHHNTL